MRLLAIETSCDETSVALLDSDRGILAEQTRAQWAEHRPWGGVVPELAARLHLDVLDGMIELVLGQADTGLEEVDLFAATAGPGLIGGLMVGMTTARSLAIATARPYRSVNHLEAHLLSVELDRPVPFPRLCLLVSGGHCQIWHVGGVGAYRLLGRTLDDSVGEAFDKTARLLGLPWPGGPALEQLAATGRADPQSLPRPMLGRAGCDFSFSGLKTAVRRRIESDGFRPEDRPHLAASFQEAVIAVLLDRVQAALAQLAREALPVAALVVVGGVAANRGLREAFGGLARAHALELAIPPLRYCTDNAAMIAWAALARVRAGLPDGARARLDTPPRPRWQPDAPEDGAGG